MYKLNKLFLENLFPKTNNIQIKMILLNVLKSYQKEIIIYDVNRIC